MAIGDGKNSVFTLAASASIAVQPPSGEEWVIRDVGLANTVTVELTNGTIVDSYLRYTNSSGWARKTSWYINNSVYIRITNPSGASAVITYYTGMVTNVSGTAAGRADAVVAVQNVAASASITVQPPSGETWMLLDVSSAAQTGSGVNDVAPQVSVSMTDGTTSVAVFASDGGTGTSPGQYGAAWAPILTNTYCAKIANLDALGACDIGYTAVRMA